MQPPQAEQIPTHRTLHGETVVDPFAWLRNRDDPRVVAYLTAENEFTAEATAHLDDLRRRIFDEIKTRTQETDLSAPARRGPWWYLTRTVEGLQYPIFARRADRPDGPEQVILDVNEVAADHEFCRIGVLAISTGQTYAAYSVDFDGSEHYTMRFRDLTTGRDLPVEIPNTTYSAAWSADDRFFFYVTTDAAHRPHRLWRHELGTDPAEDVVVYTEDDERFFLSVATSQDHRYLLVELASHTTSEVRYLPTDRPLDDLVPILPREPGVRYVAEHREGRFLVITDRDAPDGKVVEIPVDDPDAAREIVPHRPGRRLVGLLPLARHTVVFGRDSGLTAVWTLGEEGLEPLTFDEPLYTVGPERNLEYDTSLLRLRFESLVTPARIIDVDLQTGERTVVKETPVLGGYDPSDYVQERRWARSVDGTRVPISLVMRKDRPAAGPAVLYGYGAYESSLDPWFSIPRLSLLDRGVTFAIAHVRGGGEMGRRWYEDGKMEHKQHTFDDFAACATHLCETGVTRPDRLAGRGGSAGGLLIGAVANQHPEGFAALVAQVPFVDVINTMLDESLPLTVIEWEEWGDPRDPEHYRWMRAYAPYENVAERPYPAILATAGLHDPRVQYWEPAKWVAKLRTVWSRPHDHLLLKTEMGAGHAGPSGRYEAWREEAFILAWILDRISGGGLPS